MRRLFDHTVAAQEVAFDALRPGVTCADVDGAVLRYFEENDLLPYWRQHVGHAIGLRNHEAPFLDVGDHTLVEPGMVFTIEPGLYSDTVGGFRHSDTVVVTAGRNRCADRLPEGHREPDHPGLNEARPELSGDEGRQPRAGGEPRRLDTGSQVQVGEADATLARVPALGLRGQVRPSQAGGRRG